MTTATDWDVRDSETNDQLTVTDVEARIDQLDGAATEAPVQIEPWVAKTPPAITPAPTCGMCGGPETGRTPRTEESEIPARTWARMSGAREWPQIPDTALTSYGRAQAGYDSAHQQIQDLRDLAFWAETEQRKAWSAISPTYTARRLATENRYETEIARLHSEDDDATYAAYVKALPDYVRGNTTTVATQRHTSVYGELAPERIQDSPADVSGQNREATPLTTPERATGRGSGAETSQSPLNGPEDRQPSPPGAHRTLAEVHDGVRRDALTTGEQPALEPEPEPPLVGGWRVWAASAVIGIVGLAATIGALVVWA